LIFPHIVRIARIDTQSTAAAQGPFSSGYDPVFRQPRNIPDGGQLGGTARAEMFVECECQVQAPKQEELSPGIAGDSPVTQYNLILSYRDLQKRDLVEGDGRPKIWKQDRVVEIRQKAGDVVLSFEDSPRLWVHEVVTRGWGLAIYRPKPNLVILRCRSRDVSPR
jgi:hypothetical protein